MGEKIFWEKLIDEFSEFSVFAGSIKLNELNESRFKEKIKDHDIHFDKEYPLRYAIHQNSTSAVKILVKLGALIPFQYEFGILKEIISNGNTDLIKFFIEMNFPIYPSDSLRIAVDCGKTDIVSILLELGANPNTHSSEAVINAAESNYCNIMPLLIKYGAAVNAENNEPIKVAAKNGFTEMVKLLIEHGADPKADSNYPIKWASYYGHTSTVKLLMESGANIHTDSDYPFKIALANGYSAICKLAVRDGIDYLMNPFYFTKELRNFINETFNYPTTKRVTEYSCLILQTPIEPGGEYYQCPNKPDHVFSKEALDDWALRGHGFTCLMCQIPLDKTVFINQLK